jgi:SpoVK/Ycf46/Vps4 family AAA+-type ATPase
MSQEYEPHNGFEKSAAFYLEAAETASLSGQARLAVHLFRAAFEIELTTKPVVSGRVIVGLRKAWDIACEQGDRSTAESLFSDLAPYNSQEQNEQATLRLQTLALDQLGSMGITEDELESMASFISHEMQNPENVQLRDVLKSTLEQLGLQASEDKENQAIQKLPPIELIASPAKGASSQTGIVKSRVDLGKIGRELRERHQHETENAHQEQFNYEVLAGFESTLAYMRSFGFLSAADGGYRDFIAQSAAMHGVSTLSLDETFLFFGPSREDTTLFALATAGEIGFPLLRVSVDLDGQGSGTIKLAGPFRRGFFGGPPDLMEMATPLVVLIENIDYLQQMFMSEQEAIRRHGAGQKGMVGGPQHSMQAEITAYLRALSSKPGIFIMATAEHADSLHEPLSRVLGPMQKIEIAAPKRDERRDVLVSFATEHPSFAELDVDEIARFSDGLSRHELVAAVHASVEVAYRESLRTGKYHKVTLGEVLVQLSSFLDHGSPLYQQVEDEVVAEFYRELDEDLL